MSATMPGAMSAKASDAVSAATVPAALSPNACAVSAATMLAATMPASMLAATMPASMLATTMLAATMSAATMSAATPAGVCFECEKRHDEEQRSRQASAGRQHRPHGPAGLGTPHRRGRPTLGISPRTKSF
jgi:hypothetical protein